MSLAHKYIPFGSIPRSIYAGTNLTYWCSTDTKENFLAKNPNKSIIETEIEYKFNTFGYRCPNFNSTKESIKVISIGCSNTFGVGLKQEDLFHERVCTFISNTSNKPVVNWNLSIPGISNDYILRMLLLSLEVLKPHFVIINFTFANRREYFGADGSMYRYTPISKEQVEQRFKEIHQRIWDLSSDYDDTVNLYRNYKSIRLALKNIPFLFSFCMKNQMGLIKDHIDLDKYVGEMEFWPQIIDLARDGFHVGPKTHQLLSEKFITKIDENKIIDKILENNNL
jgi:hypothetical protein